MGECRQFAAVVARLVVGRRIERACGRYGKAIIASLSGYRDCAVGRSCVLRAGEPPFLREGPQRAAGGTRGGHLARFDVLRAVRIRHIRPMHLPAMCH
jgi:hypothetical protein